MAITDVSSPGLRAGGATTSRSELRGLTRKFSDRKALDGPAMRPTTPLAVENGVGKLAAQDGAQCQPGKESVANSHPQICPRPVERLGGDFFFACSRRRQLFRCATANGRQ